ncbi:hypothetical protein PAPYR_9043 [Paratrimastix pyriformis]|uniref:Uncharacterized protein n=1 Tax=Paratrimastix pyriformis TaxID=342808 RepID=A0ABQ8UCX1_9EUKA|nr:hypothetical protein PAPYR_9043 [Paratrimastix pyriformis]
MGGRLVIRSFLALPEPTSPASADASCGRPSRSGIRHHLRVCAGSCEATTCPAPVLSTGQVVLSGCGANAAVGSTCTLGCAWGYYPAPGASQGTGQCTQTDVGTAGYPTINLHCDAYTCDAPSLPASASVATGCVVGAPLGSGCTLKCPWGYAASGDASYPCQATGAASAAYTGGSLACSPVTCPARLPLSSEVVLAGCEAGGALGSSCLVRYAAGYVATGNGSYPCTGTGPGAAAYRGGNLTCIPATCPALHPTAPKVVLSGCLANGPQGSPCQLGCAAGFVPQGNGSYPCAPTGLGRASYTGGTLTCTLPPPHNPLPLFLGLPLFTLISASLRPSFRQAPCAPRIPPPHVLDQWGRHTNTQHVWVGFPSQHLEGRGQRPGQPLMGKLGLPVISTKPGRCSGSALDPPHIPVVRSPPDRTCARADVPAFDRASSGSKMNHLYYKTST